MKSTDKEYSVNMSKLSSNIEKLTNSIADGFALLRQVILPQPTYGVAPQYIPQRQANTVPFTHNVDGSMPLRLLTQENCPQLVNSHTLNHIFLMSTTTIIIDIKIKYLGSEI